MSYENKVSSLDLLTGGYFWSLGLKWMFCKISVGKISFLYGILKWKIGLKSRHWVGKILWKFGKISLKVLKTRQKKLVK